MSNQTIYDAFESDIDYHMADLPEGSFLKSYLEETVDLLDNLGYVNFSKDDGASIPSMAIINKGIHTFRQEFMLSVVYEPIPENENQLSEYELDKLAELSHLEGGFRLNRFKNEWQNDPILLRVVVYRMSLLGLFQPTSVIDMEALKASIKLLGNFLQTESNTQLFNMLDDFNALIRCAAGREWKRGEGFRNMLMVNHKGISGFDRDTLMMKDNLWTIPQRDGDFYGNDIINKPWLTKKAEAHCKRVVEMPFNTFMARLIQLKLWMAGFYHHKIDGDMRIRSIEALVDLYDLVLVSQPAGQGVQVLPSRFVFKLGKGYWIVNYKYFLLHGIARIENYAKKYSSSVKAISVQLQDMIDEVPDEDKKGELRETIHNAMINNSFYSASNERKKQKVRKSKSFMRMAIGFLKRIKNLIKTAFHKVKEYIQSFFRKVKNAIGYVIREIREALAKVSMAFRFFFSKRTINTKSITSDFDGDFDVVSILNGQPESHQLTEHTNQIEVLVEVMDDVFDVLPKIVGIIIKLSHPAGWVKLGLQLLKVLFKEKFDVRMRPVLKWV